MKDIGPEGLRLERDLGRAELDEILRDVDANLDGAEGRVEAAATRNGARVFVRARVRACFRVPCARCLEPADVRADGPVSLTYVPAPLAPAEGHELVEDDLEMLTYRGDEIDLSDVVRDQVLLALPIVALCRADCRGLCQRCGADLNAGPCACPPDAPRAGEDRPLAHKLKALS